MTLFLFLLGIAEVNITYIGCYADLAADRALNEAFTASANTMTVEMCVLYCHSEGNIIYHFL